MSHKKPDFINKQFEFTAHIRDPENNPIPAGIESRRMNIYNELFYNNIEGFISSAFPVLKTLYSSEDWHKMIRDFFKSHRCKTPYFLEISQEFLAYIQTERSPHAEDPAFIIELTHYEWVELALMISEETNSIDGINPNGDLLTMHPVISPLAWSLAYQYPVHKINVDFIPDTPPETPSYLVIYRDRNDSVEFMEVNPVTARLIQLINEDEAMTGQQVLKQIAEELQSNTPDLIFEKGLEALQELQQQGILLGVR